MVEPEKPVDFNAFMKKQTLNPMRWLRFLIAGVVLGFVWQETGIATVIVFALVAIAFELVDISQRWNDEVNQYKYFKMQGTIVQLTAVLDNLIGALNLRRGGKDDDSEGSAKFN